VTKRYGLYSPITHDFLTHGGKVLWHSNQYEMAYLFTGDITIREIPSTMADEHMKHISEHPRLTRVKFPLRRSDFVNG